MRSRRIGNSELVVSEVGFGTWTLVSDWWGRTDDPHEMIKAALDAGINFIDTAPVYGADGAGETILADYLSARDDIVITTKVGYDITAERKFQRLSPPVQAISASRSGAGAVNTMSEPRTGRRRTRKNFAYVDGAEVRIPEAEVRAARKI